MRKHAGILCVLHFPDDSAAAELLTVWEVEACSSPASCSSWASMWNESRCSCSSGWEVQTREQRGQPNASPLWPTCWLLMCSCISSSPPNTAGQYGQRTADAAEPGRQTVETASEALLLSIHSYICYILVRVRKTNDVKACRKS